MKINGRQNKLYNKKEENYFKKKIEKTETKKKKCFNNKFC